MPCTWASGTHPTRQPPRDQARPFRADRARAAPAASVGIMSHAWHAMQLRPATRQRVRPVASNTAARTPPWLQRAPAAAHRCTGCHLKQARAHTRQLQHNRRLAHARLPLPPPQLAARSSTQQHAATLSRVAAQCHHITVRLQLATRGPASCGSRTHRPRRVTVQLPNLHPAGPPRPRPVPRQSPRMPRPSNVLSKPQRREQAPFCSITYRGWWTRTQEACWSGRPGHTHKG